MRVCIYIYREREICMSPLRLRKQPKASPNLFQRGVEYGKYDDSTINDNDSNNNNNNSSVTSSITSNKSTSII